MLLCYFIELLTLLHLTFCLYFSVVRLYNLYNPCDPVVQLKLKSHVTTTILTLFNDRNNFCTVISANSVASLKSNSTEKGI